MFSVAFKNGIIMLLIILIVHFLIKNYMSGLKPSASMQLPPIQTIESKKNVKDEQFVPYETSVLASPPPPPPPPPLASTMPSVLPDDEELLKYVQSLEDSSNITFNASTKNTSTCEADPEVTLKKGKSVDPTSQSSPYFFLNEYDNENVMNGGHLFQNIDGFETSMMYSEYEKLT